LSEVAAEPLECLELRLGVLVGHARARSQLLETLKQTLGRHARTREDPSRLAAVIGDREQQVFGGDVGVLELLGVLERVAEHGVESRSHARRSLRARARDLRHGVDGRGDLGLNEVGVGTHLLHDGTHDSFGGVEQRLQQVLRFDHL